MAAVGVELQHGDPLAARHGSAQGVLAKSGIWRWVYPDDSLLLARCKSGLRTALRECGAYLRRAGFTLGDKSEATPSEIGFIGDYLDSRAGTVINAVGALVGAFGAWGRGWGPTAYPSLRWSVF